MIEIELKARLDRAEPVKARLDSLGTCVRAFEKDDTYWIGAGNDLPRSGVRVRRENNGSVLVTYKTKEIQDGVEINDEREFGVSDAAVFEELLGRLGLRPDIRKEKRGHAWTIAGQPPILAELSRVTGLGWFIELEILAQSRDEQTVAESRARLLSLLADLDVAPERIEGRTYTEMLRKLRPGR